MYRKRRNDRREQTKKKTDNVEYNTVYFRLFV
jgi:hypothetical protein